MNAKLEFNLPEEQYDFNCAINGWKYRRELLDLREQLRVWRKHGCEYESVPNVIELLWKNFVEEGVDIDE